MKRNNIIIKLNEPQRQRQLLGIHSGWDTQTKTVYLVWNFSSTQHEELTLTKAILKNDDTSLESENNAWERTNGKHVVAVVCTRRKDVMHVMTVEAVDDIGFRSALTYTNKLKAETERTELVIVCVCKESMAYIFDY